MTVTVSRATADGATVDDAAVPGLGATLVIAYVRASSGWPVDPIRVAAFLGALLAVGASYVVATSADRRPGSATILLAGVAMAAFFTAVQTYVQQQHSSS